MRRHSRAISWVGLVFLVAAALYLQQLRSTHDIRLNQLESCARGNVLRTAVSTNAGVLADFLETARKARQDGANTLKAQGDKKLAKINQDAADAYHRQQLRLVPVLWVSCEKVVR